MGKTGGSFRQLGEASLAEGAEEREALGGGWGLDGRSFAASARGGEAGGGGTGAAHAIHARLGAATRTATIARRIDDTRVSGARGPRGRARGSRGGRS